MTSLCGIKIVPCVFMAQGQNAIWIGDNKITMSSVDYETFKNGTPEEIRELGETLMIQPGPDLGKIEEGVELDKLDWPSRIEPIYREERKGMPTYKLPCSIEFKTVLRREA